MDILLIAGLWLDGSVWRPVAEELEARGQRAVPIDLPGQGDGDASATLADQVAAVVAAVDSADGQALVVGHSAACTLAWLAADARPDKIAKVVLIGGFPNQDGDFYADFFPIEDGVMAFPGWGPFDGPDTADMDEEMKREVAARAIPVPEAVARGVTRLADERRYDVPIVLICPEFSPSEAKNWIDGGEVPELGRAKHLSYVDIDSGHWPMFTAPAELARLLTEIAAQH